MRGQDRSSGSLFSYVELEKRVPSDHPPRLIRSIVNDVPGGLSGAFEALYSHTGRPGIAPEHLLRAVLLRAFHTIRSERQLMEQLDFNLLFRWFVGLGMDEVARGGTGRGTSTARNSRTRAMKARPTRTPVCIARATARRAGCAASAMPRWRTATASWFAAP